MLKKGLLLLLLAGSSFAWWDASFPYRTQVNVSNSGSNLTDYQVNISLNTQALVLAGKMRSDCADLRIVASNDSTQLPFWIESGCNNTQTKIWVKSASVPAGISSIYLYYGNLSATSASNGRGTFIVFDDFAAGSSEQWTMAGVTADRTTNHRLDINGVTASTSAYLDKSADIGNFEYLYTYRDTSSGGSRGFGPAVSDTITNNYVTSNDGGWAASYAIGSGAQQRWLYLKESGTTNNAGYAVGSINTIYYGRLIRNGTNWIFKGYTDAARTAEVWSVTNTQANIIGLKYIYAVATTADAGATTTGWMTDIRIRKYASPEPTTSTLIEDEALQFTYRKEFTLNNAGSALTDYQVNLTMDTTALILAGKMRPDCADMRFTNSPSYNTQNWTASYKYWIESGCNTGTTKIWVKVPSISTGTSTIYLYYGNSSAALASNGTNTFLLFDDFSGSSLNTNLWSDVGGTNTIVSGYLDLYPLAVNYQDGVQSKSVFDSDVVINAKMHEQSESYNPGILFRGDGINWLTGYVFTTRTNWGFFKKTGDATWVAIGTDSGTRIFQWNSIEIRVLGNNLKSIVNSALANDITDNTFSGPGRIGMSGLGGYSKHFYFDDFRVRKYASSEPTATEQLPDTTPPSVLIQSPNSTIYAINTVPVNFTATDNTGVSSCTVRLNGTVNSSICGNYSLTLANGVYTLNLTVNDTAGNLNSSQVSFTVATDTTPPAVTIQSPANTIYPTDTIPVSYTATDDTGIASCTVRLNGTVNSSTCNNYTLTLASGVYTLNVTANDTSGNINSSQVLFNISISTPAQSSSSPLISTISGIADENVSFSFTPASLKLKVGAQEYPAKALKTSTGVNKVQIRAKVTSKGQTAPDGTKVTYTIFSQ